MVVTSEDGSKTEKVLSSFGGYGRLTSRGGGRGPSNLRFIIAGSESDTEGHHTDAGMGKV